MFVVPVAAAVRNIVNDPAAGTTLASRAVASLVVITAVTVLAAVTIVLVITTLVAAAATEHRPRAVLIVAAPGAPLVSLVLITRLPIGPAPIARSMVSYRCRA